MRSQPRAEQGPKTFHGIDMHFMKSILILISSIFAFAMANHLMRIAPFFQSSINVIFVGINERVRGNGLFDNRFNRFLLDVLQHLNRHLTLPLNHAQDGRFFSD